VIKIIHKHFLLQDLVIIRLKLKAMNIQVQNAVSHIAYSYLTIVSKNYVVNTCGNNT